jgi:replication factor C subunit 1
MNQSLLQVMIIDDEAPTTPSIPKEPAAQPKTKVVAKPATHTPKPSGAQDNEQHIKNKPKSSAEKRTHKKKAKLDDDDDDDDGDDDNYDVDDDEEEDQPKKKAKREEAKPPPPPAGKKPAASASSAPQKAAAGDKEDEEKKEKKKFNPYNQEKKTVPNAHLREQKIEEHPGSDTCLFGLTFVITGVLDSLERNDAEDLIQRYGGKVTKAVSGKTSYLVVGEEPGESKLKKVNAKTTKIISEDELFALIVHRTATGAGGGAGGSPAGGSGAAAKAKTPSSAGKATPAAKAKKVDTSSPAHGGASSSPSSHLKPL